MLAFGSCNLESGSRIWHDHRQRGAKIDPCRIATCDGATALSVVSMVASVLRRRVKPPTQCGCRVEGNRRGFLSVSTLSTLAPKRAAADDALGGLVKVDDPETYSALVYTPPVVSEPLPVLVVLPGAGRNEKDAYDLANLKGEHGGLVPSLIASNSAPKELLENFNVVAPYAQGKRSFYEEPRKKMLSFIDRFCARSAGTVDVSRLFLLGFSDGATEVMELASTRRFAGCIVCSYGFTGDLPALACERLKNIPVWVFHCADDVIFPVKCSDKLVKRLREVNSRDVVRYSRFDKDQEGFGGSVKGHSTGITASKMPEIYTWLLSLPKLQAVAAA